jgi:hypothetical protein
VCGVGYVCMDIFLKSYQHYDAECLLIMDMQPNFLPQGKVSLTPDFRSKANAVCCGVMFLKERSPHLSCRGISHAKTSFETFIKSAFDSTDGTFFKDFNFKYSAHNANFRFA